MIKLTKKYKSGSVIEILQEAILSGDIPGGTEVTQNELAEALGTSRMPVREALIALEYQGLVERHTNQHVTIAKLFDSEIYAIFNDMAALELKELEDYCSEYMETQALCKDQKLFHELIYKYADSPLRRKLLKMTVEIYLSFVLDNTNNMSEIEAAFTELRETMNQPKNLDMIRAAYKVYAEVLAEDLVRIRREKL